jgi:hypothetical protein
MIAPGHDGCSTLSANDIHSNIAACIGAIAKLTKVIVSPALHTTLRSDCAGMGNASCDRMRFTTRHRDNTGEGG